MKIYIFVIAVLVFVIGIMGIYIHEDHARRNVRIYGKCIWHNVPLYADAFGNEQIETIQGGQPVEIINYRISYLECIVIFPHTNVRGFIDANYIYFTNDLRYLRDDPTPIYGN